MNPENYKNTHGWVLTPALRSQLIDLGIKVRTGRQDNRTDGEIHWHLRRGEEEFEFQGNRWDWDTFKPLFTWVKKVTRERSEKVKVDPQFFIRQIDRMLNPNSTIKRFEWARETLEGIRDTIKETEKVTKRQRDAIHNIKRSKQRF